MTVTSSTPEIAPGPETEGPKGPTAAEQAAQSVLEEAREASPPRRGGRRPGAGRPRGIRKSAGASPEPEPPPEPTPAEIEGVGRLWAVLWAVGGERLNRRALQPAEQRQLAAASIPVLRKYGGGVLEKWAPEINLTVVVLGLWFTTENPKKEGDDAAAAGTSDRAD